MNNLTDQDKIRMKTLNKLIDELLGATEEETIEFANTHFGLLEENESLKAINKQLLEALEPFGKLANECLNNSSMNQNQTVYAYNRATITMLDLKKVSEILSKSKL